MLKAFRHLKMLAASQQGFQYFLWDLGIQSPTRSLPALPGGDFLYIWSSSICRHIHLYVLNSADMIYKHEIKHM